MVLSATNDSAGACFDVERDTGVRDAITAFLFVKHEPGPVDFAFVLGSPTISSIVPAINLYKNGLTSTLVISGRGPTSASACESEIYRDFAVANGVPASDIILETRATNTKENFAFSRVIVEERLGWDRIRRVAISGKPFHMRRAQMTARVQWPRNLELLMLPSSAADDPPAETWWQAEHGIKYVLAELRAIGTYGLQGDLGGF